MGRFRTRHGWTNTGGPGRPVAALFALLGFLFASTAPGLSLVAMAGAGGGYDSAFGVYICSVQVDHSGDPPGDETVPHGSNDCCLICQVAQLVSGAVPPQHFTLPTESAAKVRMPVAAQSLVTTGAARPFLARAPPAV